jgi:hypothetical protein
MTEERFCVVDVTEDGRPTFVSGSCTRPEAERLLRSLDSSKAHLVDAQTGLFFKQLLAAKAEVTGDRRESGTTAP